MAGIVVLGLGNPVLCDDMAGLQVAAELQRLLEAQPVPAVEVLASTRAGFELIDLLQGFSCAIIVDCLELPEPQPGRVRKLDMANLAGSARLNMMHEISLDTAFKLAAELGIAMPTQVEIYAIEAADTHTLSEAMTPAVAACIAPLAAELLRRVTELAEECGEAGGPPPPPSTTRQRVFYPPPED